jgi:hypothetical protein
MIKRLKTALTPPVLREPKRFFSPCVRFFAFLTMNDIDQDRIVADRHRPGPRPDVRVPVRMTTAHERAAIAAFEPRGGY